MKINDLIGNTPLIELQKIGKEFPNVQILAKMEGQNPGGSVKDRPAFYMIDQAIKRGEIKKGDKLVEATSGNTGIALAMVASSLGVDLTLIMPENSTLERIKTMKAFGAKLILTPAEKTIEYSRELAENMVQKEGYFSLNQFANQDNYLAHYYSTAPEIWDDTNEKITHFISSMGTTGTIMGVSKFLKEKNKNIQIIGAQPTDGSNIPGIRRWTKEYLPKIYDSSRVDKIFDVSQNEATEMTRKLAKEEGIFVGMSSGGALVATLKLCQEIEKGVLVFICCDRGDRYVSGELF
jgi:cysteine synthase B